MPHSTSDPVTELFDAVSNWGRWGPNDQLGTLNFCDSATTLRALSSVRSGDVISCSRPISAGPSKGMPSPAMHHMLSSGDSAPLLGEAIATDWFGLAFHGGAVTHIDSFGHIFWNQRSYNGIPSSSVSTVRGATEGSIEVLQNGVVTRGILLDIPRALSVEWLEPGHAIVPEELELAETIQGVHVDQGDLLYVRTGRDQRRKANDPMNLDDTQSPGLDLTCMPWLRQRSVSVLGSDAMNDVVPSPVPGYTSPIHVLGIAAMGLWFVDNAYLETLRDRCIERQSWSFLAVLSPLVLRRTTGSPLNPLAVL